MADVNALLGKVQKLLRLATSSNQHEAALAAAKAQELIDENNLADALLQLDGAAVEADEPIIDYGSREALDDSSPGKLIRWRTALASRLCTVNGCRLWRDHGILHIVGRPSDVSAVRYLYGYLAFEVERLAKVNGSGCGRTWLNNYRLGCVDAINHRLHEHHSKFAADRRNLVCGNPQALMRINNALAKVERKGEEVQRFMEQQMGIKFKVRKPLSQGRAIQSARAQGQRDGKEIKINAATGGLGSGVKGHINE
jgi:hypothetical protein